MLAAGGNRALTLWEVASGKQRARLTGEGSEILSVCFGRGSRLLVSGNADRTAMRWDVWDQTARPDVRSFDRLWEDLAHEDAGRAFRSACAWLRAGAFGVRQMEARLRLGARMAVGDIARQIAELDSDDFAVREAASRWLAARGESVKDDLERALGSRPSLEVRSRIDRLLGRLKSPEFARLTLRESRAVEVLEQLASPEAVRLLRRLSRGGTNARLTREASAALGRMGQASPAWFQVW
jgi:hypothetical protein